MDPAASAGAASPGVSPKHDRYLAADGSDKGDGSASHPWRTLQAASSRLRPGDILWIGGGTYPDLDVQWTTSGTAAAPITVRAMPGERPVFEGASTDHRFLWLRDGAGWINFLDITVRGFATFQTGVIVISDRAHDITFTGMEVRGSSTGTEQDHLVYISAPDVHDVTIQSSLLASAGGAAVHVYHAPAAQTIRILDNDIESVRWGVLLYSGVSDVLVRGNTFIDVQVAVKMEWATSVRLIDNTASGTDGIVVVGPPVQAEYADEGNTWPKAVQLQAP